MAQLCFSRMKVFRSVLIALIFIFLASCSSDEELKIGVSVYDFSDSFITEIRNAILESSEGDIPVTIVDAARRQQTQNEQIEKFIEEGYSAIIVNSVDRTASWVLIEKCRQNNVPLVFINREPVKDDMAKWDKVYYVGAKAEDSGIMAGEIMADYWFSHPEADRNGDGILQFVVIKGETGHQDTELRTEYFIETLISEGIPLEKLHEDTGRWTRNGGYDVMSSFINRSGDSIEAVFANNDDMALGAIEVLQQNGYFNSSEFMPVIGIDGTPAGQAALQNGLLLGTVFNDAENQGKAAYNIAKELAEGRTPTSESIGYPIVDNQYVWIPYRPLAGQED